MSRYNILKLLMIFTTFVIILGTTSPGHGSYCGDCDDSVPKFSGPNAPNSRFLQANEMEWTTSSGEDLDIYYGNQYTGGGCSPAGDNSVDFTITIDQDLSVSHIFLILSTFDVDYSTPCPDTGYQEVDNVYINGHYLGYLTGANQSWSINTFTVPLGYINAPGENAIKIEIDTLDTPVGKSCWCVNVDWGTLTLAGSSSSGVTLGDDCTDYGYDADNDGLYDTLKFDISVTVIASGEYNLNGALYGASNNLIAWATKTRRLSAGSSTMTLEFNGEEINCKGEHGPYTIRDVTVYDIYNSSRRAFESQLCTTSYYSFSQFKTCTTSWTLKKPALPPLKYKMISVPLQPDDPNPLHVFGDNFGGTYDTSIWRLFWRNPSTGVNQEYPNVPQVSPGIAYWIVSRYGPVIDAAGILATDETYSIIVSPGWFQLGNPFYGTVYKDDLKVVVPGTSTTVPLSNSQSPLKNELWATENGTFYKTDRLLPWEGYYIYNMSQNSVTLIIPNPLVSSRTNLNQMAVGDEHIQNLKGHRMSSEKYKKYETEYRTSLRTTQEPLPGPPSIPAGTGGIITGMVTDAETSSVISDANIYIDPIGSYPCLAGLYLVASVPAGSYKVSGYKLGYQYALKSGVTIATATNTTQDFSLQPLAPINIKMIEVTCSNPQQVDSPRYVRVVVDSAATPYYQFWTRSGYGTSEYENRPWILLKSYSTDNMFTWTPTSADHYILMVWVNDNTSLHAPQMGGLSVPVGEWSDVRIVRIVSDITRNAISSTPIHLTTTTSGSSTGSPYHKYWVQSGYGIYPTTQPWTTIREYSTTNYCEWIPNNSGNYTLVVHVVDDFATATPAIAGMTCSIGQ